MSNISALGYDKSNQKSTASGFRTRPGAGPGYYEKGSSTNGLPNQPIPDQSATGGISSLTATSGNGSNPQQVQVSPEAKALIRSLLTVDSAQRPGALEILQQCAWVHSSLTHEEKIALSGNQGC